MIRHLVVPAVFAVLWSVLVGSVGGVVLGIGVGLSLVAFWGAGLSTARYVDEALREDPESCE